MKFRTERDSLGKVSVPEKALFGAQTSRAIHNFQISGRKISFYLIRAYLRLKKAAAWANWRSGVIQKDARDSITGAINELLAQKKSAWRKHFPLDPYQAGAGTCLNMNINEVVANLANLSLGRGLGTYHPIHPNDHVNASQSTNDTFPTAMRMAAYESSGYLQKELKKLAAAFQKKANAWKSIHKSGRTHLQDAVPMTLGEEIGAYAVTLQNLSVRLNRSRKELLVLGLGGSAVGNGVNVPPQFSKYAATSLRKITGDAWQIAPNLIAAMQSQISIMNYSSALRMLALEMTRICNDLRLLGSGPLTGLAELEFPAVQPGSSIMPGKVNPSILEMGNQTWYSVLGFDQTVAYCMQAGQLELNVMMPMMAYAILEATSVATHALRAMRRLCVEGLEPNRKKLQYYFESTPQVAAKLSPTLGYEKTAELVQEALKNGVPVSEWIKKLKK